MPCANRLLVAYKPPFVSSNHFLGRLKRKYNNKKAGFSGTLDPFAKGCLIVAFGQYTKLFSYIKKAPKVYRATLWLGVESETLDIEKVSAISEVPIQNTEHLQNILESFLGEVEYIPPKYSAKKIDGKRAYELARSNQEVRLKKQSMSVYSLRLLNYSHPFVTFETTVSEGAYIRSLGKMIAEKLGCEGTLSSLERVSEGNFEYNNELSLDPIPYLGVTPNNYNGKMTDIELGKKLQKSDFSSQENGLYSLVSGQYLSIISLNDTEWAEYKVNRIELC